MSQFIIKSFFFLPLPTGKLTHQAEGAVLLHVQQRSLHIAEPPEPDRNYMHNQTSLQTKSQNLELIKVD